MAETFDWPEKTRELHSHHFDSTVWNDFPFRDDDIVIGTYGKSGTTWTQQIVAQLLFAGDPPGIVGDLSPWLDLRFPPGEVKRAALEAQEHRRFIKTHLPVDALNFSPKARYLYIARDGRDIVWSFHNHFANATDELYAMLNDTPGLVGPPMPRMPDDPRDLFHEWLAHDGAPLWSFWENIRTWWEIRDLPNVKLFHFVNLKDDLEGEMRAIAEFLEIDVDEADWPRLVEHCTFDHMKAHADDAAPLGGAPWKGGGKTFIHKGTNGRRSDALTAEDCAAYENKARQELGEECAHWLATGDMPGGQ